MKKFITLTGCLFFLFVFSFVDSQAQAYIQYSHQDGSVSYNDKVKVVNGEAYVLQLTGIYGMDGTILKKYAADGTLIYSRDLLLESYLNIVAMEIINNEVYLLAGRGLSIKAIKVRADGSIAYSRLISDTTSTNMVNPRCEVYPEIIFNGNEWIISAIIGGINLPTTMGTIIQDYNFLSLYLVKINTTTGVVNRSMAIPVGVQGCCLEFNNNKIVVENGYLYTALSAQKNDLPVSIGNLPGPGAFATHVYVRKLKLSDFSTVFSRYLTVDSVSRVTDFVVRNGEYHVTGTFPGSKGFYTKLYADGSMALTKGINIAPYVAPDRVQLSANHVYVSGAAGGAIFVHKMNTDGSTVYSKINPAQVGCCPPVQVFAKLIGDEFYFAGTGARPDYPVTNNSTYGSEFTGYVTHYDPLGNMVFSSFTNPVSKIEIENNKIYLAGFAGASAPVSTDSSQLVGLNNCFVTVLKPNGSTVYNGYFGGSYADDAWDFDVDNGSVFLAGTTYSTDFPTTEPAVLQDDYYGDGFLTKISFCPNRYDTHSDTLSPSIQTVCKYGLAQIITGRDIIVPGDSLPLIYKNSVPTLQRPVKDIHYQWQKALSLSGPWINITDATERDFRPVIGTVNEYFRRQSFTSSECSAALIHTSDTAMVIAGPLTAPIIDFESPIITCPSSSVQLDGIAAITGGQAPYTYSWDMGLPSVADPVVAPAVSTVYTLLLTDMLGCQQLGQVVVSVYKANAGTDKRNCGNQPVRIGTAPLPGSATSYDWTPAVALDNSHIAQPMANPLSATEYTLTVNLTKPDGTICTTQDTVQVVPVAAPVTPQFAGADKVICNRDSAVIGSPAEAGFTYAWSPANYITNSNMAQTAYFADPPEHEMPFPDPATLYVYAKKDGCSFPDTVVVTIIEADAGDALCHAGVIGMPDLTPSVPETYSWSLSSGPGNFLGSTNAPQVPVSASVGGESVYELTVSYNGKSCQSGTVVFEVCPPITGGGCRIEVMPSDSCADFAANGGHVTLIAVSSIPDGIYTWEPQVGLSAYTGSTVQLTDNIPRIYTVTVVSAHDSSLSCSASKQTNPGLQPPVFAARDTITCAGVPVMIGAPAESGYTYEWAGDGLSDYNISDPVATVTGTTLFQVTVTNARGCKLIKTLLVTVPNTLADAGEDRLVCGNAIVTLGVDSLPNTTYSWDPPASAWQNGTNQFSAHPQVLSAVTVTYTLTTTSGGCSSSDDVNIEVNNSPVITDAPDEVSCKGRGVWIGSQPIPGVTYQWSPVTGLDDPTSSYVYANPASTTTYTLTATFPGNCVVPATDEVTVTVNDPSFSMPDIHFCPQDGPIALGTNAPPGMSYYYWQPTNLVTNYVAANPSTLNPPPQTTTIFTLYTQNASGCVYVDTIALIPHTEAPLVSADRTVCKNQSIHIGSAANVTGPSIVYSWSPATNLNDPSDPNAVFTATTVGTFEYVLTKTDNSVLCTVTDTVVLTVVDILPSLSSPTVCRNSCVQIGTAAIVGIDYVWSPQNGLSNPYISNPVACIDTASIVYTLTATDQAGCTISADVVIGLGAIPGVQASVPDIVACVGDDNVMFVPSVPAGSYSYLWSPDDGTLSNINIANPYVQTIVPGPAQYNLQITDNSTGCTNNVTGNITVNTCSAFGEAGNFLWFDNNGNGIQDPGEIGVSGQAVRLFNNVGFNVATVITDANGFYNFASVTPGTGYYISFDKPAGYEFTLKDVGGTTATNNSKADVNGRTDLFDVSSLAVINYMDAGIKPTGAVPVTLLDFTARLQSNSTVLLNWQTTAEINNHYFDVERSSDGILFSTIGTVNGHGTTSIAHSYSLIDPHPLQGYNYYRLRQVDFDGHFMYSTVRIVELKNNEAITAWYNSQSHNIQIIFNKKQDNLNIKLYATNGQLVKSVAPGSNLNVYHFDVPVLATGVYMLQVTGDKLRYSKKIFINQ